MKSLKVFIKTKIVEWCIRIMFPNIPNWIKKELKQQNILICGQTGSGKSSLINYLAGKKIADVGDVKPTTKDIKYYETKYINIYDSEGYEIGSKKQADYEKLITNFLTKNKRVYGKKDIHLIWYCIDGFAGRYKPLDKSLIEKMKNEGFKVCVLITKTDEMDDDQKKELVKSIKQDYEQIDIFKLSIKENAEWKSLIKWSYDNLEEVYRDRFLSGLKIEYGLEEKEKHTKTIINWAVAAAAGVAATPIPISDAPVLIGIQTTMCVKILSTYNIKVGNKTILALIQGTLISNFGKMLVGWILKFIPGGSLINATVAAGITKALGNTLLYFANKYVKAKASGEQWVETFEEVLNSVDFLNMFKNEKLIK